MLVTKHFPFPLTSIVWTKNTMEVNGNRNGLVKKCKHVWNDMILSKWWQNLHFWVYYHFKTSKLIFSTEKLKCLCQQNSQHNIQQKHNIRAACFYI